MFGYLRRIDEARADYEAAQRIAPSDAPSIFRLAFPLLREGRYEEGLALTNSAGWGP